MKRHTLFVSRRSPFCRKVLIAADVAGRLATLDVQEVVVSQSRTDLDEELLKTNPLAQIPTLRTAEGEAIFDSRVICRWFDSDGASRLFPCDATSRRDVLVREALTDGLIAKLLRRGEELRRPEEARSRAFLCANEFTCNRALDDLNTRVARRRGCDADMGDVGLLVLLDYIDFRLPALGWRSGREALAGWRGEQGERGALFPFC